MNKLFAFGSIAVVAVVVVALWGLVDPLAFLPHERLVIGLPFSPQYDSATGMIPMGETKFHPKPQTPNGHPGIDFQWDRPVPVIASADGVISRIDHGSSSGIDVAIRNGSYELRYKELNESSLGENIKVSNKVLQGDYIALPGGSPGGDGSMHYQVHWEFASTSVLKDRFCPLTCRGDELYFLPKPVNGSLADLQEAGYAWDGASGVIVSNRSQPACHSGKSNGGNNSLFYCNDWGYYAKIPPSDREFIRGQREAHSYLIDLVLSPENKGSATRYKVVSAFCSNKEPEM